MSLIYLMAFCSAPKGWDYTQIRNLCPSSKGHTARQPVSSALKASRSCPGRGDRTRLWWNRSWFQEHWTQILVSLSTHQTAKGEAKCRPLHLGYKRWRDTKAQFNDPDWYPGLSGMIWDMRKPPGVGTNHTGPVKLHALLSNLGIWGISGSTWSLL